MPVFSSLRIMIVIDLYILVCICSYICIYFLINEFWSTRKRDKHDIWNLTLNFILDNIFKARPFLRP